MQCFSDIVAFGCRNKTFNTSKKHRLTEEPFNAHILDPRMTVYLPGLNVFFFVISVFFVMSLDLF